MNKTHLTLVIFSLFLTFMTINLCQAKTKQTTIKVIVGKDGKSKVTQKTDIVIKGNNFSDYITVKNIALTIATLTITTAIINLEICIWLRCINIPLTPLTILIPFAGGAVIITSSMIAGATALAIKKYYSKEQMDIPI